MNKQHGLGALAMALILSFSVLAGEIKTSGIKVEGAWSRATVPGQDAGMADFIITVNGMKDPELIAVSSPVAKSIELHSMETDDNGMMKMREVKAIYLPLGEPFELGHNGLHVMLMGLKKPLKVGDQFPLTLTIKAGKQSTKVKTSVEVRPLNATKQGSRNKHRHH